jgi:hypothetical protein
MLDDPEWQRFFGVIDQVNARLQHLESIMREFVRELARGQEDDPEVQKILRELEESS